MSLDDTTAGHLQELRRGTVVLGCLAMLRRPDYGYSLLESLGRNGLAVDANTLYPLLRRLEKQGLLTSEWNTDEARPRKFYRTSPAGDALAKVLAADWRELDAALARLTGGTDGDER
ncbi:PadR family transcriptional regulator [Agromyces marinus]|nr:helix-turn-helix transcriptional regulator [Agromyces marinus]UIP57963.1 Transcriptional regulator [Agromyces marinus]